MRLQSACAAVHAVQPQHAEADTARGDGVEAVGLPRQLLDGALGREHEGARPLAAYRLGLGLGLGLGLEGARPLAA